MAKNGEKLTKKGPEIVADADVFSSPGFILRLNGLAENDKKWPTMVKN